MFRKLQSILAIALAMLLVTSAVTLAADEMISGTVQKVDPEKGRMTLRSVEGKTVELQAPAALLEDLETGDIVQVRVSGQKATDIQKGGALKPDTGGTSKPQRPGGMQRQ